MKSNLRRRVLRICLIPVTIGLFLLMALDIVEVRRFANIMEQNNLEQNDATMETMSKAMLDMTTESFQKVVISEAKVLNGEFENMRHDLELLARQVQMILERPSVSELTEVPLPSPDNEGTLALQLLFSEYADRDDPVMKEQIQRIGRLGKMILGIVERSKTMADCQVSLASGASIVADSNSREKFSSSGELLPYNAFRRPWYVGALVHQQTFFSSLNADYFSGFYDVMAGVPVYVNGELVAVCGSSIPISSLAETISEASIGEYSDACIINENGNMIYSTLKEGELAIGGNELASLTKSPNPELVALVNEALKGGTGFSLITLDGAPTYVAYAPVKTVGWTELLMIAKDDLNRDIYALMDHNDMLMEASLYRLNIGERQTISTALIALAVIILLAFFLATVFVNRLVRPINRMTEVVSKMQGEDMTFKVEQVMRTGDEVEVLARAFENMSEKMKSYVQEIIHITAEKQRLDTELSVAAEIQANLLPKHFPPFPDIKEFDLYATMKPAKEVGGDFFDFFLIDDDHLAFLIADVSGKGVPAALFMVKAMTLLKSAALADPEEGPAAILEVVNRQLCEGNDDNMFVTTWMGILTIADGSLVSSSAGHEYPVFYRKKHDHFKLEKDLHGLGLGAYEGTTYKDARWTMDPGDMLFLYTDGVPEANNKDEKMYGADRMLEGLTESWSETAKAWDEDQNHLELFLRLMRKHVDDFAGDQPQFDDITMLCLEYKGNSGQTPVQDEVHPTE